MHTYQAEYGATPSNTHSGAGIPELIVEQLLAIALSGKHIQTP